jgi:hypothetical protein
MQKIRKKIEIYKKSNMVNKNYNTSTRSRSNTPSGSSLQVVLRRREGAAKEVARRAWSPFWTPLPLSNCDTAVRFVSSNEPSARARNENEKPAAPTNEKKLKRPHPRTETK